MADTNQKTDKELKQVNFRLNPETANAFREFCNLNGMNQAQGFDHIMQVLELNNAKAVSPGRAVEIEEFERHVKAVMDAYLRSLELCDNAELRMRERFQSDIQRYARTIDELQEHQKEMRAQLKQTKDEVDKLKIQNTDLTDKLVYSDRIVAEQKNTTGILQDQIEKLQDELEKQRLLAEQIPELQNQNMAVSKERDDLTDQVKRTNAALSAAAFELDQSKKELEEGKNRIQELLTKLEKQDADYKDLLRQMNEGEKAMESERNQLKMQAELQVARAVAAKEKEMQERLMAANKESMQLAIELKYLKENAKVGSVTNSDSSLQNK